MSPQRKRIFVLLKTVVAAVLIVAVGWHFEKLLRQPAVWEHIRAARFEYLIPAGFLYLAAHIVWGTFWVQLLRNQGVEVPWFVGIRAYFVSQFGKYVPGKAWVLVLRVALLRHRGLSPTVVAVTATYETLTSMAAGALLGICLLPFAGERIGITLDSTQGLGLVAVAALPLALGLMTRFVKRLPNPPLWLLFRGLVQDSLGWCLLALSLWLTVRGVVSADLVLDLRGFGQNLAAVTLSYVAGFVVLVSPGGLGAREFVLQQILAPDLVPKLGSAAAGVAVVVALTLRLVWTAFEVVFALLLLALGRREPKSHPEPLSSSLHVTIPRGEAHA